MRFFFVLPLISFSTLRGGVRASVMDRYPTRHGRRHNNKLEQKWKLSVVWLVVATSMTGFEKILSFTSLGVCTRRLRASSSSRTR